MANAKNEVVESYPKIVKLKNGEFCYQFKLGETQILKVQPLVEAYPFSDGYARVKVLNQQGEAVYKFLSLNGRLSTDEFYNALDYSCGRALCQKKKGDKFQFREFDGSLNPQLFDVKNSFSYKRGTATEINAGLNLSNKLNLYGFAVVSIDGTQTIINMLGEYSTKNLPQKEVINRGIQLYNFYYDQMGLEDLDKLDLRDPKFNEYVKKLILYKHNLNMIASINDGSIEQIKALLKSKTKSLQALNALTKEAIKNT